MNMGKSGLYLEKEKAMPLIFELKEGIKRVVNSL
jgi:hypothetical protein